jgi:hypothetical protein
MQRPSRSASSLAARRHVYARARNYWGIWRGTRAIAAEIGVSPHDGRTCSQKIRWHKCVTWESHRQGRRRDGKKTHQRTSVARCGPSYGCPGGAFLQARDHRQIDAVRLGDRCQRFTGCAALDGFGALVVAQLRLSLPMATMRKRILHCFALQSSRTANVCADATQPRNVGRTVFIG